MPINILNTNKQAKLVRKKKYSLSLCLDEKVKQLGKNWALKF